MKGLQIRSTTIRSDNVAKALGARPVNVSMADLVIAYQKGTIDGSVSGMDHLVTYRLADVTKYTPECAYAGITGYAVIMNWDAYNRLSPDLQKIIDNSCADGEAACVKAFTDAEVQALEYGKKIGHEFYKLTDEEAKRWNNIVTPNIFSAILRGWPALFDMMVSSLAP